METITITKKEYDSLTLASEKLEALQDVAAYDIAMASKSEGLPHKYMMRLIEGEAPLVVFRQWRELSSSELARRSGVNRVQIVNIEKGNATGSVATLKKLAHTLDITLDQLAD